MPQMPQLESGDSPAAVQSAGPAGLELHRPSGELHGSGMQKPEYARLPVSLDVAVPFPHFRVRDLVSLEPGQVIESSWACGEDMPLSAGRVQLVWTEFEVVDQRIAVRVTRLV